MIYDNRLYQLEERLGQDFYKSGDRRISLIVVEDAGHLFETKEKAEEALSDYLAELEKIQEARKVSIGPSPHKKPGRTGGYRYKGYLSPTD